nr:stress response protein NST1-like [Leptinotarsa decemlineata]
MAERERRRQVAMAHQEAIRQQLAEREKQRQEERERRMREEREEEKRIGREREIERKRREEELQIERAKQERERRRKEVIEEAIVLAQKEAQAQKTKKFKEINIINDAKNIEEKDCSTNRTENSPKSLPEVPPRDNMNSEERKSPNYEQLNNTRANLPKSEHLNTDINNKLEIRGKGINSPRSNQLENVPDDCVPLSENNQGILDQNTNLHPLQSARLESNLAAMIPTSLEALQTIQYALLVPATPHNIPLVGIPLTDRSCSTSRTENRILTPTQYRNKNRKSCDSSTQTEESVFARTETSPENREKYIRDKLNSIDLTYDNKIRRERRSRSEGLEDRPKWGANRPPTRYLKQSEKDPLYQRKKMRQKLRDSKGYDDKNSSDDSQTASPRSYRRKGYPEKRHSRQHWRKNEMLPRTVRMYQTEMIPLESDKDQIYYKRKECCCMCRCGHRCSVDNVKVDILKIEHNSPREQTQYKCERSEHLPDVEVNNDILEKLASLHDGLLMKRDQWETTPSSPSISSAYRQ